MIHMCLNVPFVIASEMFFFAFASCKNLLLGYFLFCFVVDDVCPESQCHFFKTLLCCNVCSLVLLPSFESNQNAQLKILLSGLIVAQGVRKGLEMEYHLSTSLLSSIRGYLETTLNVRKNFFASVAASTLFNVLLWKQKREKKRRKKM